MPLELAGRALTPPGCLPSCILFGFSLRYPSGPRCPHLPIRVIYPVCSGRLLPGTTVNMDRS